MSARARLRRASASDRAFGESLHRANMWPYLQARGIAWDPERHRRSWAVFETYVIVRDGVDAGVLMLHAVDDALEVRDLQIAEPCRGRGLGTAVLRRVQATARKRGFAQLRLRVYDENPARRLYERLGFEVERREPGRLHMRCDLRGA